MKSFLVAESAKEWPTCLTLQAEREDDLPTQTVTVIKRLGAGGEFLMRSWLHLYFQST